MIGRSEQEEERSPGKSGNRNIIKSEERSPRKGIRRTPKTREEQSPGKEETGSQGKADWRKPATREQRGATRRGAGRSLQGEEQYPKRGESRRPKRTEERSPGRRGEGLPGNREERTGGKGRDRNPNKGVEKIPFKASDKISGKAGEVIAGMRLNKYLSHCGIASRRAADTLIMQGHVTVNGVVVQEMGYKVQENDIVVFKGKPIRPVDKLVYYLLNKPRNVLSTSSDERGRKTVIDIMSEKIPERIYPVGRLDRNTSGLILLTNDGELTKKLSHPSHKVPKVYHVTLDKNLSLKDFEEIRAGITLEDGEIKADSLHFIEGLSKREVEIELHSGRNRIVRRIFEHFGYEITKLDRVYYAGLTKKNLPRGHFRPLTKEEIRMLKHFT